jgi:hypothetical protein
MDCFLHIGAMKTGSSAMQTCFAQGRAALAAAGLWYPASGDSSEDRARRGLLSAGNGWPVAWLLQPSMRRPDFDRGACEAYVVEACRAAGPRPVLFSHEMVAGAPAEEIAAFARLVAGQGRRLRAILFVRHVLDHAVALYQQVLKQGRLPLNRARFADLDGFIARHRTGFARQIETWAGTLGEANLAVLSYDEHRADIPGAVLRIALPPGTVVPALPPAPLVNRSLTGLEMLLYEALNAEPEPGPLCLAVSDALTNAPATERSEVWVGAAAFEAFRRHNQDAVARINARWFGGREALRLASEQVRIGEAPPVSARALAALAARGIAAVLHRARDARGRPGDAPGAGAAVP